MVVVLDELNAIHKNLAMIDKGVKIAIISNLFNLNKI